MISPADIDNSVDLYSGQVQFPISLASLAGRNGLDYSLNMYYSSQVLEEAGFWNLTNPTGVLGLGWSLPFEGIFRLSDHSAVLGAAKFYLSGSLGNTALVCTGESSGVYSFAAESYSFWQISYNPSSEKWTIIVENGDTYIYGDSSSGRSTVQWGVNWENWIDSSNQTVNQSKLAIGWNLSTISNRYEDELSFSYTAVEKAVASAEGIEYTQASYLHSVKNALGQSIVLGYKAKDSSEYQDPHTNPTPPNAYQDRFESQYLDSVQFLAQDNSILYSLKFTYASEFLGSGNLSKRLLSKLTRSSSNGKSLPGNKFSYYTSADGVSATQPFDAANKALYGALKTVTFPEGGTATYQFSALSLGLSDRKMALAKPSKEGVTYSSPKFYFKSRYTLVSWKGSDDTFSLQSYVWDGRWLHKDLGSFALAAADYEAFQIELQNQYFGFYASAKLYLFHTNPAQAGEWIQPKVAADGATDVIYYSPVFDSGSAKSLAAADSFFAICGLNAGQLALYQYYWNGAAWAAEAVQNISAVSNPQFAITAVQNQVFAMYWQSGANLAVYQSRRNISGAWNYKSYSISGLRLSAVQDLSLYPGASFVSFAIVSSGGSKLQVQYGAFWTNQAQSKLNSNIFQSVYVDTMADMAIPSIHNSMVMIGQNSYRFDGQSWINYDTNSISYSNQSQVDATSVGIDRLLRKITTTGSDPYVYDLLEFDPSTGEWGSSAAIKESSTNANLLFAAAREAASQSVYALVANKLYLQASDGTWSSSFTIPDTITADDLATVQLIEENLLAYQVDTGTASQKTVLFPLKNGGPQDAANPIELAGEQIYQSSLGANGLFGEKAFVTYTGTFDSADSALSLYRPVRGAVSGKVELYLATLVQSSNGYTQSAEINALFNNSIAYEASTAIASYSGYSAQINKASQIPGSASSDTTPNGTIDSYFFNGLAEAFGETPSLAYPLSADYTNTNDYYSLCKGVLYTRNINAFQSTLAMQAQSVEYHWVYALTLGQRGQGFYQRTLQKENAKDGVSQTQQFTYDSNTGFPSQSLSTNYNAAGELENWIEDYVYFYQKYDTDRSLNLLSPIVQTTKTTHNDAQSTDTITGIYINTWKEDWGSGSEQWSPYKSFEALSATPPAFDSWQASDPDPASGWLKTLTIKTRNTYGLVTEQSDVDGLVTSSLLDTNGHLSVAACRNASNSAGEFSYYDFEPYAQSDGWNYLPSSISLASQISTEDYNTGTQCLKLAANASEKQGPFQNINPQNQNAAYVFGFWAKVDADFDPAKGAAQWEITVYNADTKVGSPIVIDFSDSISKWSYYQYIIDLNAIRSSAGLDPSVVLSLDFMATNQNSDDLNAWLDNLRFSPLLSAFEASVYDPVRWRPTAAIDHNGQLNQWIYNSLDLMVAKISANERVDSLSLPTYSRSLSSDDDFLPEHPNSELNLGSSQLSLYYDFHNVKSSDWTFSPASDWHISSGTLNYSPASPTSGLGGTAVLTKYAYTNFAARLEVDRSVSGDTATVSLGNGYLYLQWNESSANWNLIELDSAGTTTVVQSNSDFDFGEDWLFMVVDNYVLCFVNGVQLFNYQFSTPSELPSNYGKMVIATTDHCSFDNVILFQEPQMRMSFKDGLGNQLQSIALQGMEPGGSDLYPNQQAISASGVFLDSMGRQQYIRNSLTAPLQFGNASGVGDETTPAQLIEADQNDYLYSDQGTELSISDYLSGTDGDLSFSTYSYEASPLSRPVSILRPRASSANASDYTESIAYSGIETMPDLAGQSSAGAGTKMYYQKQSSGVQSKASNGDLIIQSKSQVKDLRGNVLAVLEGSSTDFRKTEYVYDANGNLSEEKLPNYFAPPANSEAGTWKKQYSYSFNNLLIQAISPDAGTVQYAYDSANRLRFKMDAAGAALNPQQIIYFKYDTLGRLIEEGYIQSADYPWGSSALEGKINTAAFPITDSTKSSDPNYASGKWLKSYQYDSNGTNSTKYLLGRLWKTQINNGSSPDSESKLYDAFGNITQVSVQVQAHGSEVLSTNYSYNNQDQVASISYPKLVAADTALEVSYSYDRLGRLAGVGQAVSDGSIIDPSNPPSDPQKYYAWYKYDFEGRLAESILNSQVSSANPISRTHAYSDEGFLLSIEDQYGKETLGYTDESGYNGLSYFNGLIASSAYSYKAGAYWENPPLPYSYQYAYDVHGQLTQALNSANNAWTLAMGPGGSAAFDANGNIQNVQRGADLENYKYLFSGSDKISSNQLANLGHNTTLSQDFEGLAPDATSGGGWAWNSNNGGPSNSGISTLDPHSGSQCLHLAGGSLGHYNVLSLATYLNPQSSYALSSWIKTEAGFDTGIGEAGWYISINQAEGPLVETRVAAVATSVDWTELQSTIDLPTLLQNLALDINTISSISLELRNYKRLSDAGTGAGLFVDDISLSANYTAAEFHYNANGNASQVPNPDLYSIDYDPISSRTTAIQLDSDTGAKLAYQYGARNTRTWETYSDGGGTLISSKLSLYGTGDSVLGELNNGASAGTYYIHGLDGIVAISQGAQFKYPLKDHLGSSRIIVDGDTGDVLSYYDYMPYGDLMRAGTGAGTDYRYTGQEFDSTTGLYNYKARLFDTNLRRFMATDPAAQYASPYNYVGNNPVNRVDPSGEFAFATPMALGFIAAGLMNSYENWDDPSWSNHACYFLAGGISGMPSYLFPFYVGGFAALAGSSYILAGVFEGAAAAGIHTYLKEGANHWIRTGEFNFNSEENWEKVKSSAVSGAITGGAAAVVGTIVGKFLVGPNDNAYRGVVNPVGRRDRYEAASMSRYYYEPSGRFEVSGDLTQGMRSAGLIEKTMSLGKNLKSRYIPPQVIGFEKRGFDLEHLLPQRWFRNTNGRFFLNGPLNLFPVDSYFNQVWLEGNIFSWTGRAYPAMAYVVRGFRRAGWIAVTIPYKFAGYPLLAYAAIDYMYPQKPEDMSN